MQKLRKFLKKNVRQIMGIVAAFMVTGLLLNANMLDYQANLLFGGKKSAPFDGTTYPVKKVPSWVDLTTSEWKLPYDQIPLNKFIDLPEYIPSQLVVPFASLDFKNAADKAIRNAQVTYSTPYMGDYKLDGREYAGSHLAVDIKIPMGTPLYAIANGLVIKSDSQTGGFGNSVVLRHDDVPSMNDPATLTTYYSGYGHMSSIVVNEGDLVSKGQLIGYSGESGTATTPHVHFQIDNDQAPWHIYWPYTSKEASDAGLSFWDAVNAGLGKDKALATTISPVAYVQKFLNYSGKASDTSTNNTVTPTPAGTTSTATTVSPTLPAATVDNSTELPPANTTTTPAQPVNITTQPTVDVTPATPALAALDLQYNDSFKVGTPQIFKVMALDNSGQLIQNFQSNQEISIKLENGSGTLDRTYLTAKDFDNGIAQFSLTPTADFGIRVSITSGAISKTSDVLEESSFSDLNQTDENFVAINFLKNNDIVRGYPDGTFKPNNNVTRVEALKFIYEGLNKDVKPRAFLQFADTDSKAWYARYIAAAQKDGVIKGYANNLFKPANPVTRAEFVKMLVEAAGYDGQNYVALGKSYSDVKAKDWFYTYVSLARDKNLLDTSTNLFRPNDPIKRADVAAILYRTILVSVNHSRNFDKSLVVNADDLAQFYKKV